MLEILHELRRKKTNFFLAKIQNLIILSSYWLPGFSCHPRDKQMPKSGQSINVLIY